MGRAVGSRRAAWAGRRKHRAVRNRRLAAVLVRGLHARAAESSWALPGQGVDQIQLCGRLQSADGLVRRGRAWHRSRYHHADGRKSPQQLRVEHVHEKSRNAVRDAKSGIPPYFVTSCCIGKPKNVPIRFRSAKLPNGTEDEYEGGAPWVAPPGP